MKKKSNAIHRTHAPRCALPDCNTRVRYHSKKLKVNGEGYSYKWKTFCEHHRTSVTGKEAVNIFKNSRGGCESWKLGWPCPGHHGQFTIDHYDGNKYNNDEDNLLVLCPNCHQKKTNMYGDTLGRYENTVKLPEHLWDEE